MRITFAARDAYKVLFRPKPVTASVSKEQNHRRWFEENSQDFFLLRELQNIREGPDTCICQIKDFQIQSFNKKERKEKEKKERVFRKADMTAWMEQELFIV